jgi:glyoxylase-like metal-dependent hydrolase (beta-lactamase superfamily II)
VIDTAPNAGKALLAEIRQRTKLPIEFVVNTHYHPDHVANNGVFTEAGATILAHRNVRGWIHKENLKFFGDMIGKELSARTYPRDRGARSTSPAVASPERPREAGQADEGEHLGASEAGGTSVLPTKRR